MIGELEQCSCGILFTVPITHDKAVRQHFDNALHERALLQPTCGPCFMGACLGCEGTRNTRAWRCQCDHSRNVINTVDVERISEIRVDWSNYLSAGLPAEYSRRAS